MAHKDENCHECERDDDQVECNLDTEESSMPEALVEELFRVMSKLPGFGKARKARGLKKRTKWMTKFSREKDRLKSKHPRLVARVLSLSDDTLSGRWCNNRFYDNYHWSGPLPQKDDTENG